MGGIIHIGGAELLADHLVVACLPHLPKLYGATSLPRYKGYFPTRDNRKVNLTMELANGHSVSADCVVHQMRGTLIGGRCTIILPTEGDPAPRFKFHRLYEDHEFNVAADMKLRLRRFTGDRRRAVEFSEDGGELIWWVTEYKVPIDYNWLEAHLLDPMVYHARESEESVLVLESLGADRKWKVERVFSEDCAMCGPLPV